MSNVFDIYRAANATAEVLPDIPEGRSYRVQAKPTAHTPVQRWAYPFALRDKATPDTMHSHMKAIASMRHGFFPLSSNGCPNGSLHFGKACKDALDYDAGFRCIADGEVIAYRLDKQLHVLDYGPDPDQRVIEYSLGFVLVRHWLPLPPAPANTSAQPATTQPSAQATEKPAAAHDEGIYLYSLYSYNRPWVGYPSVSATMRRNTLPFWQGERVFRVGEGCKDQQAPPPETPQWLIEQHARLGLPPPTREERPLIVGRRVRAAGHKDAEILAILPRGTEVTVEGDRTTGWAQLRTIGARNPHPAVQDDVIPPEAAHGWVWLDEMDSAIQPTPETLDTVVVLGTPYPVKAGERLGYLGENPAIHHAAPRPGPLRRDPAMALEVFAGEDFPAYLAQARERTAALPDTEKTVLTIAAGSKGVLLPLGTDRLLSTQVLIPEADNPPGPFVRGKRYDVVPTPPASKPGAPAKKTSGFRCSADGRERIEAAKFAKLPPAEQTKYPCEEVLELADNVPVWGPRDGRVNYPHDLWDNYPLTIDRAILAPIPFAMAIPRRELDALPPEHKATDPAGVRWWKVEISVQNGTEKVWVAEKGMPGVSWQSPQAWPAFTVVDGSGFSLLEAFQRHAVITGTVHPEHEQSFTATANALAHNELIVQLEKAIDESGDKNGRITGEEIAMARTKPLLANALSRMIVRFESHWSTEQDRWAALDEIMGHEWKGERERQTKRGWWNEVASGIDSFPQDPRVYHIHPFGWVDNFKRSISVNIEEFLNAYESIHASLGVFSPAKGMEPVGALNSASRLALKSLVNDILLLYEEAGEAPNIHEISYMLATARHEAYNWKKGVFFAPLSEIIIKEDAERSYGQDAPNKQLKDRATDNGNTSPGDGYRYRGRGYVQLTWKKNYKSFGDLLNINLVENPDLANDRMIATRIMFLGMRRGMFTGVRIGQFIGRSETDYVQARKVINGDSKDAREALASFAAGIQSCLERTMVF